MAAAEDPDNLLAVAMPISLVLPCDSAEFGISDGLNALDTARSTKASWGIAEVGADTSPYRGTGVRVAVLDTGIVWEHPAFTGIQRIGRNFTAEGQANDVTDLKGHGTHCAGTIFGRDVDNVRIGVAPGVPTGIVGKVLNKFGKGTTTGLLKALQWAVGEQQANVVSVSVGFDFPQMQTQLVDSGFPEKLATSMALKSYRENLRLFDTLVTFLLQESARNLGAVIVAAAGNESRRHLDPEFVIDTTFPAAASPSIVSVGATLSGEKGIGIAPFSNANPSLCAPGVDIVSADLKDGLVAMSGTSMACPHVAGLAALWWESSAKTVGRATGTLVRAQLIGSARASGLTKVSAFDHGAGRARAPAMLNM
jgi:subtilisin family serine protease